MQVHKGRIGHRSQRFGVHSSADGGIHRFGLGLKVGGLELGCFVHHSIHVHHF